MVVKEDRAMRAVGDGGAEVKREEEPDRAVDGGDQRTSLFDPRRLASLLSPKLAHPHHPNLDSDPDYPLAQPSLRSGA